VRPDGSRRSWVEVAQALTVPLLVRRPAHCNRSHYFKLISKHKKVTRCLHARRQAPARGSEASAHTCVPTHFFCAAANAQTASVASTQPYYYYRTTREGRDASDVREKLGLARGRVLRRVLDLQADKQLEALPDVIWECDYPNLEAREADVARLNNSKEFDDLERHMNTLIANFSRVIFEAGG
jgi:hypothetical protein